MKDLYVINSLGEREPFSLKKIYVSCRNSGLDDYSARRIVEEIKEEIYPGITTFEISRMIDGALRKEFPRSAIKFSLKGAIRRLGPAGFTFEKYVGEIFSRNGYQVRLNQHLFGFCNCQYEIDFLARKNDLIYVGECKYHNLPGERIDLRIALANHARFLDISKSPFFRSKKLKSILVTNTKFTSEAMKYSECVGVDMLGWKHPKKRGLEYLIEKQNLYPITILPSFKGYLTEIFAQKRKMLVLDLLESSAEKLSRKLGVKEKEIEKLVKEAEILLG
ncbi:MAG: hypothetical protein PHE52_02245 [Candidatus Pacebacteria bacterium]|nr:hypothetical protein [Candidatus Paceibacterota bacterium]